MARKKFHCKTEAQKKAIQANYARIAAQKTVPVKIKNHKDKNGGHPHVIVDNIDENHVSVGLSTKKKKGKNHPNYPLQKSPLNDGKTSFMRRQGVVAPKEEYYGETTGDMTVEDFAKAREYGERAKQRYISEWDKKA